MVGDLAVEMTGLSVAAGGITSGGVETMSISADPSWMARNSMPWLP